ncbi:MAG: twin-arginine translocation signal domain-containing protein, partial [Gammaproteobacteria bacterium]|nr:twin-arginine translocation signal domain-containing protein [Gammaproteobacteria bacterium]
MLNRRDFLQRASLALVATGLPPMLLAKADTDARLVVIVLRGAMDGMAMLAPYGDGNYRKLRGELALAKPGGEEGVLKLDGLFGLHPSMENVFKMYSAGHALLLHAVASPYRARSHFDGQDILENGGATVHGQD